ncbi:MAG TPA: PQQ-binding-like beta-propeller repeat protein [Bryobacteraceae bacterium]|nr:PQQ-binding-like beta-propeller repeat protein [Bryobacteraceae bacterium]
MASHAQQGTAASGEWRVNGGDAGSTRYSPLEQINAGNVQTLQVIWRWKAQNMGPAPQAAWEVTPLMVGGRLYFTAGAGRTVVAADAATGETLWLYRGDDTGERGAVRANNRGVSYWTDGRGDERILFVTPGYQLVALNAKTGLPVPSFGSDAHVDLWQGLDRPVVEKGTIGATSPPIIIRDVVVVGAALKVGVALPKKENVPGYIRGYDVRTGKLLWTFHTVPQAGEFGVETWQKDPQTGQDSWKFTGNTGAWGPLTGDEELGYVYIPVEAPSGDTYGGQRPGQNLFSDSIVCLDAKTGKRIWHYQLIHHEMWDYDIPAAPILLDLTVNGKKIKALAQVNKSAYTFVFDRTNGQPVWPIEERPVPKGNVPGEWYSPTQPYPTKPAAFDRQGVTEADLADYTPEIKAAALKMASQYVLGPIYTPPIVKDTGGKLATIQLPGAGGGANWMGASVDPETGILYVPSVTAPYLSSLQPGGSRSEMPYIAAGGLGGPMVMGVPLIKGPYGRITAINLNTGEHVWMVPNGKPADSLINNPALKAANIDASNWGGGQRSPILVTKTLLFEGSNNLRVIDKATGRQVHAFELGGNVTGGTMTYLVNGRQFLVAVVGGRPGEGAELVGLAIPRPGERGRGGRGGNQNQEN